MSNYYVYQRLEDLVHELNPTIVQPYALAEAKVNTIIEEIKREKQRVQTSLQDLFYRNNEKESTAQLIRKSHHSLVVLINKSYETRNHDLAHKMNVVKPLEDLMRCLDQLLHWFHENFNNYLLAEQPYPITKLKVIRSLILEKQDHIKDILRNAGNHDKAIAVVMSALEEFVAKIDRGEAISKHEAEYHKDLLNDIERTNGHSSVVSNCPPLHELLVYWNLNSKECIRYFTKGLEEILRGYDDPLDRLEYLRLQFKYVAQMPELPDFTYDPRYPSIKKYFGDYLSNEIEYLNNKTAGFLPVPEKEDQENNVFKVLCNLSGDQISLILRALQETGIIIARSLNLVFKRIVPYLSTPNKVDPSWENMRRKSYTAEVKDKNIVIELLMKLIDKVKEY